MNAQEELLDAVRKLNEDPAIHGILVQLPLPPQCDEPLILKEIAVHKDADGFSAMNVRYTHPFRRLIDPTSQAICRCLWLPDLF